MTDTKPKDITAAFLRREAARFEPATFGELVEFSKIVARSDVVPKAFKGKPDDVLVAIQMGAELGLKPLQSLQNVAVINGRPSLWGDAMLALVITHRDCIDVRETTDPDGTARCVVMRRGRDPVERTFSDADAKAAGLDRKEGPWQQYRGRMKQLRARGFALRDAFPDALRGVSMAEEVRDEVDITDRAEVIVGAGTSRAAAALAAIAPAAVESVDVTTGEISETPPPVEETPLAPEPPKGAVLSPEEMQAEYRAIDAAMDVDAVNEVLDRAREYSADSRRGIHKRAAQRMKELKP